MSDSAEPRFISAFPCQYPPGCSTRLRAAASKPKDLVRLWNAPVALGVISISRFMVCIAMTSGQATNVAWSARRSAFSSPTGQVMLTAAATRNAAAEELFLLSAASSSGKPCPLIWEMAASWKHISVAQRFMCIEKAKGSLRTEAGSRCLLRAVLRDFISLIKE